MAHCLSICSRQKTESSLVLFLSFPLRFKNIKSCWLNFQNTHYIYLSFLHRPVCIAASFTSFTEVLLLILPAQGLTLCLSRQYSTAKGHCLSTVKESLHKTPACQPSLSPISHLLVHLPRILAVSQTWWTGPFGRPLHQRLIYPVGCCMTWLSLCKGHRKDKGGQRGSLLGHSWQGLETFFAYHSQEGRKSWSDPTVCVALDNRKNYLAQKLSVMPLLRNTA